MIPNMRMKGKKNSLQEFKRFCLARPGQQEIIKNLIKQGKYAKAEIMKSYEVTAVSYTHLTLPTIGLV